MEEFEGMTEPWARVRLVARRSVLKRATEVSHPRTCSVWARGQQLLFWRLIGHGLEHGLGIGGGFRDKPESIQGQIALTKALPPGELATTQVIVRDGETMVIGGVFVDTQGNNVQGVPYLSRMPVLGWLFKNKSETVSKQELLIFLTPSIIKT